MLEIINKYSSGLHSFSFIRNLIDFLVWNLFEKSYYWSFEISDFGSVINICLLVSLCKWKLPFYVAPFWLLLILAVCLRAVLTLLVEFLYRYQKSVNFVGWISISVAKNIVNYIQAIHFSAHPSMAHEPRYVESVYFLSWYCEQLCITWKLK